MAQKKDFAHYAVRGDVCILKDFFNLFCNWFCIIIRIYGSAYAALVNFANDCMPGLLSGAGLLVNKDANPTVDAINSLRDRSLLASCIHGFFSQRHIFQKIETLYSADFTVFPVCIPVFKYGFRYDNPIHLI